MKTLVIDDSKVVRVRVAELLKALPRIATVEEAADVAGGRERIEHLRPDLVIVDLRMPGGSGMDLIPYAREHNPNAVVIVLTNFPYKQYREKCTQLGADYFYDKSLEFETMIDTVRDLTEGAPQS